MFKILTPVLPPLLSFLEPLVCFWLVWKCQHFWKMSSQRSSSCFLLGLSPLPKRRLSREETHKFKLFYLNRFPPKDMGEMCVCVDLIRSRFCSVFLSFVDIAFPMPASFLLRMVPPKWRIKWSHWFDKYCWIVHNSRFTWTTGLDKKRQRKKIQSLNHWQIVFSVRIKIFTSSSSDLCPPQKPRGGGDGRNDSRVTVPVSTPDTANLHRRPLPPHHRKKEEKKREKGGGDSIYKNKPLGMGWGRKGRRKVATLDLPRECVSPPPRFPFFSSDFVCWWLENGREDQEPSLSFFLFWKRKPLQGLKEKKKIC